MRIYSRVLRHGLLGESAIQVLLFFTDDIGHFVFSGESLYRWEYIKPLYNKDNCIRNVGYSVFKNL
jgi:hypothetical protein